MMFLFPLGNPGIPMFYSFRINEFPTFLNTAVLSVVAAHMKPMTDSLKTVRYIYLIKSQSFMDQ